MFGGARSSTKQMNEFTHFTRACGRALDANLRYTVRLSELAARGLQMLGSAVSELSSKVVTATSDSPPREEVLALPSAAPLTSPSPAALVLEGTAGSRAFGLFVVENKLQKEVSALVTVSPLVDPDGQEIPSVLRFEPGVITLAAGEQVIAKVSARITRALAAGIRYQADISIPGISGARIPIIVRRKPAAKSPGNGKQENQSSVAALGKHSKRPSRELRVTREP